MQGGLFKTVIRTDSKRDLEPIRCALGGECLKCGSVMLLEFAHLDETGLRGRGRGKTHRYGDIVRNPDKYTLLCRACHYDFDLGLLAGPIPSVSEFVQFISGRRKVAYAS